jgi:putative glycosyltransferase (TIGR04372 family)
VITVIFNKVYVDTSVPEAVPGTVGEHVAEVCMGCSLGLQLNKKVVVIKPKNPTNGKLYDLLPAGVDLQIVDSKTNKGLIFKVLIFIVSMEFIKLIERHVYSWVRAKFRRINNIDGSRVRNKLISALMAGLKNWVDSRFYRKQLYIDKRLFVNAPKFEISSSDTVFSKNYFKQKNINIKNKFVCIHVRDHVADGDNYGRQSSMDNYSEAIKYLIGKGYSVIKIGLGSKNEYNKYNVIDLSYNKVPGIIPIYLISQCEFVISYHTGFVPYLSYMLQKPVLMLNIMSSTVSYPIKYNSMMISKTLIRKDNKKEADFTVFADGTLIRLTKQNKISDFYEFIENTEEEIVLSVKDMVKFINSGFKINNDQIFVRKFLTEKNIEALAKSKKDEIGVYNYLMKASGGDFIGDGVFCYWYAKKKKIEVEKILKETFA